MQIGVLLFEDFETLDVFGPVEFLAGIPGAELAYYSLAGGLVGNHHGISVMTTAVSKETVCDLLLVPGGRGTRSLVDDLPFLTVLANLANRTRFLLSVCTGASLFARAGLLDGQKATTNKLAYDWVVSLSSMVDWQRQARWIRSDHVYTSSGVSAGMDMTLGFISDQFGVALAMEIARRAEYHWNSDWQEDPFANDPEAGTQS